MHRQTLEKILTLAMSNHDANATHSFGECIYVNVMPILRVILTENPCLNNGTCVDGVNEYTCLCQESADQPPPFCFFSCFFMNLKTLCLAVKNYESYIFIL